ncbi:MAG: glycosyltransferase family 2 protein [Deltaproteobacteria bacterium]|nr:glycosyltransferase family 2 protein [Deltaproteobacteria bacterium]
MEISVLRLVGIVAGACLLAVLFLRLRKSASERVSVWLMLILGLALLLVAAFPSLATMPSQLLSLGDVPAGRLITLLLLSNLLSWFVLLHERGKRDDSHRQFDLLVRRLAANQLPKPTDVADAPDVAVVIPAYNEAENLAVLLPRMPSEIDGKTLQVVVVDDGSTDGTDEVARKHGALVVTLPVNRGGGAALRTGYDAARRLAATVIVTMDADGQHLPEEIEALVLPTLRDEADFVIGSRILGSSDRYSRLRLTGVVVFSRFITMLTGVRITDCSSGFRAFRLGMVEKLRLQQDQYHTAELIIDAAKRDFRITERPVHIQARLSGESKKGRNVLYALRFLRTVLTTWWR